jgi:hypothetical protein
MLHLRKNPYRIWIILSLLFVALSYIPIFLSPGILDAFVREDRIYETLSPIYLFVTSVVFALAFFRSEARFDLRDPAWIRRMLFLGLALLFFVAAGEEISWGQRILGIETPALVRSRNVQKELTFHNLDILQGADALIPWSFGQLTTLFALTFGAFIPLAARFVQPIGRWLERIFPVLPFGFSIVFLANYAVQKAIVRILPHFPEFYRHPTLKIPAGVHETREHGYEFALMAAAICYVFIKLKALNEARAMQQEAGVARAEIGPIHGASAAGARRDGPAQD